METPNTTPERKAKLLYGKMLNECGIHSEAVECAMIAADEIIYQYNEHFREAQRSNIQNAFIFYKSVSDYWQSVKEELKKM